MQRLNVKSNDVMWTTRIVAASIPGKLHHMHTRRRLSGEQSLPSSSFPSCVPPLATEPSRRLLHMFGTVCRSQYAHRRHCKFFAADWRPSFLPGRTAALTTSVSLHWLPR